jgi:hypothetical protein
METWTTETFEKSEATTSPDTPNAISLPASVAGRSRSVSPDGPTADQSGQPLARASRSRRQGSAKAQPTNDTCGPTYATLSPSAALQSSLENRLRARTDVDGSPEYVLTWKHWDLLSGEPICALRASHRPTSDKGFIGWPTSMAGAKATATYNEAGNNDSSRKTMKILKGWATPRANRYAGADSHGNRQLPLNAMTASAVLDPRHWQWLMGFPIEWEDCAAMVTRSSRSSPRRL